MTEKMFDISSFQGNVDWAAIPTGYDVVADKATQANNYTNPFFASNWQQMKAKGKKRIAYHFYDPSVPVQTQIQYLWDVVSKAGFEAGDRLAIDAEMGNITAQDVQEALVACDDFAKDKNSSVIYSYLYFMNSRGWANDGSLGQWDLWLADPVPQMPPAPKPWKDIAFWQYGQGRIPGINATVDLDIALKIRPTVGAGQGYFGDVKALHLNAPIVGIAVTPSEKGYWLAGADGGVFAFGDAPFCGSMGGHHLNAPITGIGSSPSGKGYWLAGSDGGIFTFGDAQFKGSLGAQNISDRIIGVGSGKNSQDYWLAGQDGAVYAF